MRVHSFFGAALASLVASAALADPTPPPPSPVVATAAAQIQPPMNSLDFAFYECDGAALQVMYDGDAPTHATLVTSDNRKYALARAASASGVQFAGGGVKFWTDRKSIAVEGTRIPIRGCKLKAH